MSKSCNPPSAIAMLKRLRGAATPLPLAGLFLILVSVSVFAFAGGTRPAAAETDCQIPTNVSPPTVRATSRTPAAITGYEVVFTIPSDGCALAPRTDSIVMVLHEDIGVPRASTPSAVIIRYELRTNGKVTQTGRGTASAVDLDDQDDPRRPTTITIYPAIRGEGQNASATKPIPAGATVTVTFNKAAGISNPTEGGAFSWKVATRQRNLTPVPAQHPEKSVRDAFAAVETGADHTGEELKGLLVDWEIQLSHEKSTGARRLR